MVSAEQRKGEKAVLFYSHLLRMPGNNAAPAAASLQLGPVARRFGSIYTVAHGKRLL